ncbi:MAG TPA: hypothetical protein VMS32_11310 [Verrucomicrobiae bacterium]|nr:hypothetical protein [Verrucomicrobiae bacterium]
MLACLAWGVGLAANSLVGHWQGAATVGGGSYAFDLVMQSNGTYVDTVRVGRIASTDSGTWKIVGGLLHFTVTDWEPKQQCFPPPTGCQPVPEPPGGLYRVQFLSPNAMRWQDVNYGGIVNYERAP